MGTFFNLCFKIIKVEINVYSNSNMIVRIIKNTKLK